MGHGKTEAGPSGQPCIVGRWAGRTVVLDLPHPWIIVFAVVDVARLPNDHNERLYSSPIVRYRTYYLRYYLGAPS